MTAFTPPIYQQQVLDSVEAYFKARHTLPEPVHVGAFAGSLLHRSGWEHA